MPGPPRAGSWCVAARGGGWELRDSAFPYSKYAKMGQFILSLLSFYCKVIGKYSSIVIMYWSSIEINDRKKTWHSLISNKCIIYYQYHVMLSNHNILEAFQLR